MSIRFPVSALIVLHLAAVIAWLPRPTLAQVAPTGDEFPVNTSATGDQDFPAVARDPQGGYVVVWESAGQDGSGDGVVVRRYDSFGQPRGDEVLVNSFTMDSQQDPHVAVAADGSFVVVWDSFEQDVSARGIFGQRFDATGAAVGDEMAINEVTFGDQNDPVVATFPGGGFVVVWESEVDITQENLVARLFAADGTPVSGEIDLHEFDAGDQEDAAVATDAAGNFVVVWESDDQDLSYESIVARRFDSSGTPLADEFVVNTSTLGNQDDPALALLPDGRFLVAWQDDTTLAPDLSIMGRYFDATGAPLGDELVFASGPEEPFRPAAALGPDGQGIVAWDALVGEGALCAIFIRSFDTSGSALGETIQVSEPSLETRLRPTMDGGGATASDLLVGWQGSGDPDPADAGVFARRVSLVLFADGFESGSTAAWSSTVDP